MARPAKRTSSAPPARGAPGKQPGAAKRSAAAKATPKTASSRTAKSPGEIAAENAARMRQATAGANGRAATRSGRAKAAVSAGSAKAPAPTKTAAGPKQAASQAKSETSAKQAAAATDLEARLGRLERANVRLRATAKQQTEMLADLGRQIAELRAERARPEEPQPEGPHAPRATRGQASARREGTEADIHEAGAARAEEDASVDPAIPEPEVSEGAGAAGTREGFYIEEDEAGRGGRTDIENL